jgi:hypothetical protein
VYGWLASKLGRADSGPRRPGSLWQTAAEPLIWAQNQPVGKGLLKQAVRQSEAWS